MEIPNHRWFHRHWIYYTGSNETDINLLTFDVKDYIMVNNELHRHKIHIPYKP
jgi:hypothetical protein